MKKIVRIVYYLATAILLTTALLFAQTTVGIMNTDETWSDTINVQGEIIIRNGVTLTIMPGTIIQGASEKWVINIRNSSAIQAFGTESNPIHFTRVCLEFWDSIRDGDTWFRYCIFTNSWGSAFISFWNNAPPDTSSVLIDHCVFNAAGFCHIYTHTGASPTITYCSFNDASTGIWAHGADVLTVNYCTFSNVSCGIMSAGYGMDAMPWEPMITRVDHCTFYNITGNRSSVSIANGFGVCTLNHPGYLFVSNSIFHTVERSGIRDFNIEDPNFNENWVVVSDYNCYYNLGGEPVRLLTPGSNSIVDQDPMLMDPDSLDFSLASSSSPCWNTASDGYHIGAWQDIAGLLYPEMTSLPDTTVLQDQLYTYDVNAVTHDTSHISKYVLKSGPVDMIIDSVTGIVEWTPGNNDVGRIPIVIDAVASNGYFARQAYLLNVINVNDPPEIVSLPPSANIYDYYVFVYDVNAVDIDPWWIVENILVYSILSGPEGMEINSENGVITWTPEYADVGTVAVSIQVADVQGATDQQDFNLIVEHINHEPTQPAFLSPPDGYQARKTDAFAWAPSTDVDPYDSVTYRLEISASPDFLSPVVVETGITGNIIFIGELTLIDSLKHGTMYHWRVRAEDNNGGYSGYSPTRYFLYIIEGISIHDKKQAGPITINIAYQAGHAYLKLDNPVSQKVKVSLLDINGQNRETLADEKLNQGSHLLRIKKDMRAGVYFVKFEGEFYTGMERIVFIR